MANELKTQGTALYFVKPGTPTGTAVKVTCPTGISGLGGAAESADASRAGDFDRRAGRRAGLDEIEGSALGLKFVCHCGLLKKKKPAQWRAWCEG